MKMEESPPNGLKTPWEKEKLLIISNFSFSHSVLKRLVLQTYKHQGLFGKVLKYSRKNACKLITLSPDKIIRRIAIFR